MDTRRTLQVVVVAFVASTVALDLQSQAGGLQGHTSTVFQPQRLNQDQKDDIFRAASLKPKRPPTFDPAAIRTAPQPQTRPPVRQQIRPQALAPSVQRQQFEKQQNLQKQQFEQQQAGTRQQFDQQQAAPFVPRQQFEQQQLVQKQQFEQPPITAQQFQGAPQTQPQTRAQLQTPVGQQTRPTVRQQLQRQQIRPQSQRQEFEKQQNVQRQQFEQLQTAPRQQFEHEQAGFRQQFDQQQAAPRQQFEQQQAMQKQQLEQPSTTAQQVNRQFFNSPPQQGVEQPLEPLPAAPALVRRPAQGVVRPQAQQQRQQPQPQQEELSQEQLSQAELDLLQHQAENARYSFAAAVTDTINDQQNVREETRDGLNLRGLYSYSDGYFKRTVHYEADENGYRVVKEEVDAIGDGPKGDPNGRADISSNVEGNNLQYSITSADIPARPHSQPEHQQQQQPFATRTQGT